MRRGNDQVIYFHVDVAKDDKREILKQAQKGTRDELKDHYDAKKAMKKNGKYNSTAEA